MLKITRCRICKNTNLFNFLQLGPTPIPNGFLDSRQIHEAEKFYRLDVLFCNKCSLVQLSQIIPPKIMFQNYAYIPSTSKTMQSHFFTLAKKLVEKANLKKGNLVIDIGSNDGTLLKYFKKFGMEVLGIDPSENLAKAANHEGINTEIAMFTKKLAQRIKTERRQVKLITATNVLAHINDLDDFFEGIEILLSREGIFVGEFPYLPDLIEKTEFDTIYHEHLSYFSATAINYLLRLKRLFFREVERLPIHGGSLRVTFCKTNGKQDPGIAKLINFESIKGIKSPETYIAFSKKVSGLRYQLTKFLRDTRIKGSRIVGYGASAKGNIMLNYCRIGTDVLDYIADSIPFKHYKFTPGMHIPIFPEKTLYQDKPDYILLLAWNFADEIMEKLKGNFKHNYKIILTSPSFKII